MYAYLWILPGASAVLCVALGLFTLSRNPKQPANIGFALGSACVAVSEAGSALFFFPSVLSPGTGAAAVIIGQALMPGAWLVFTSTFARAGAERRLRRCLPAIAGLAGASVFFILNAGLARLISGAAYVRGADTGPSASSLFALGPLGKYFYIFLLLGLVANLVQLENTLRSSKGSERVRIKCVVIGAGSVLSVFIYAASYTLLFNSYEARFIPVVSTAVIASFSCMSFFLVRHRLLDVNIYVSRYVVYNSLSIFMVGAYLVMAGAVTHGIRRFGMPFNYFITTLFIFASAVGLFALIFSEKLKRRFELFVSRHFYRRKYDFRDKWMQTVERLGDEDGIEPITQGLADIIQKSMAPGLVMIWLHDPQKNSYVAVQKDAPAGLQEKIEAAHPAAKLMIRAGAPFDPSSYLSRVKLDPKTKNRIGDFFADARAALCSPLMAGGEMFGFVLLGEDISEEPYGQDDIDLLTAVCAHAAARMRNIRLTNGLMAAREHEVYHQMSSFVLHDLKNFTNTLSIISQNARRNIENADFQRDMVKAIDSTVSRMKALLRKLAQSSGSLELEKTECDAGALIDEAAARLRAAEKSLSVVNDAGALPSVYFDPRALESVLRNILDNAAEATGRKGIVRITSCVKDGMVEITVTDNGAGFKKEFIESGLFKPYRSTKKEGLGIGLFQSKTIVEAHGGAIEVKSSEGMGASLTVRLPAYQGQDEKKHFKRLI